MNNAEHLKICHVITSLGVGGAEYMLKRLLSDEVSDKQQITIISLMELGKIGVQLQQMGYQVHSLEMRSALSFWPVLQQLTALLRQIAPDLVQTWMYHADLLGGLAAHRAGIHQVIWSIHCTRVPAGRPLTAVVMKICAWLSRRIPSRIVCVANAAKQNHIRYGYAPERMTVIPNGFEVTLTAAGQTAAASESATESTNLAPQQLPAAQTRQVLTGPLYDGKTLIGCIGRFHIDKGQDILLHAAALVVKQYPDTVFVLAGNEVDQHNRVLTTIIAEHQLQQHVVLLGERDDVPLLLHDFDCYCMPSRTEAFPVALGEAMLAGLPCVATRVGDTQVLGGDTLCYVAADDAAALAAGLTTLLATAPAIRRQQGLLCQTRVRQQFSISTVRQLYRQLYLQVSGTAGGNS